MRKLLLSSAMLAALLSTTPPALADIAEGAPPPPEYEVTEDGTLVIGGDVFVSCRDIGAGDADASNPQAQAEIDQSTEEERQACREAGFPTYGDAPLPTQTGPAQQQYERAPGDLDCEDFATQAEAQAALREDPSDPNGLDGPPGPVGTGEPGVACEGALPGPVDFEPVASEGVAPGSGVISIEDEAAPPAPQYGQAEDVSCGGFASLEEAQVVLDAGPDGANDLDADGNGLACEEVISAPPTQAVSTPEDYEDCLNFVAQIGAEIYCIPPVEEPSTKPVARSVDTSDAALAQPVNGPPAPDPADYVFEEGGTVTIDGDQGMSCRDFALNIPEADASPDLEQARSMLEQCEEAGFLTSNDPAPVAPTTRSSSTLTELPATGGYGLLPLAGGMLLASFVALTLALRRPA